MEEKELKEEMGKIFDKLCDIASDEAKENPLFSFILEQKEWFGDPEQMYIMLTNKFFNIIEECVKQTLRTDNWIVCDIFTNWSFFDNHVTKLCENLYGPMGSADKGRFIIKSYIKYKLTRELPVFDPKPENYHHPKTGTPQMWMNFIEGIAALQLGSPTKYFLIYQVLIDTK
jgi:hypothetical protein